MSATAAAIKKANNAPATPQGTLSKRTAPSARVIRPTNRNYSACHCEEAFACPRGFAGVADEAPPRVLAVAIPAFSARRLLRTPEGRPVPRTPRLRRCMICPRQINAQSRGGDKKSLATLAPSLLSAKTSAGVTRRLSSYYETIKGMPSDDPELGLCLKPSSYLAAFLFGVEC